MSSRRIKSFKNVSDINYDNDNFNDYKQTSGNETINTTEKELSAFNYIPVIIGVLFIIYILNWLNNIDKCTCSHIEEGKYLKEWFTFFIIIDLLWLFILIALGIHNIYTQYIAGLVLIVGFINFIFIIRTIMYIHKLKKNKCKCGSMFQQSSIYGVLLFGVSFVAFALLLLLISFIASFFVN
jgi:hypothetical protein